MIKFMEKTKITIVGLWVKQSALHNVGRSHIISLRTHKNKRMNFPRQEWIVPIWMPCISFSCLITVAKTANAILNRSVESRHPCLVTDLSQTTFSFWPMSVMLAVGFSYTAFIMLRHVPFLDSIILLFVVCSLFYVLITVLPKIFVRNLANTSGILSVSSFQFILSWDIPPLVFWSEPLARWVCWPAAAVILIWASFWRFLSFLSLVKFLTSSILHSPFLVYYLVLVEHLL